ncbi:twin-arginine translocation pathway signal [Paracidovorax avenae]|uniref:alginate O-acetyltransferase AlgX-related protein n=1 Tax=Paracidovorax avenae TaxID=80867 RepID=UPI000D16EE9E|nr:twin-arginine translocation pathway signal [Paracidovorax avenae]AVS88684.1 twin-arginine translocation pathway signal [Paracidovorax avenae]
MTTIPSASPVRAMGRSLRRRSLLAWPLALALPVAAQQQTATLAVTGKDNYLFAGWGNAATPDWAGIDATVARVADVRRRLAAKGILLVAPVLPDKMVIYEDKLPDGMALAPEMRTRYARIVEKMRAADIPTFDDEAPLRALRAAGQPVYYRTDQHWAQPAADATAQATADLIRSLVPKLAGDPGTGLPLGSLSNERRYGDLADRFLSPEQRKAVGRETFTVRRAVEADSLLADIPAPVHVTGNSMVQPYFGFAQKLSNLLDRRVSVNWKPGDVGFWSVLMEYLESEGFRKQPPQVLVWQLFEPNFHLGPDARGLWDGPALISDADWNRRLQAALGG